MYDRGMLDDLMEMLRNDPLFVEAMRLAPDDAERERIKRSAERFLGAFAMVYGSMASTAQEPTNAVERGAGGVVTDDGA